RCKTSRPQLHDFQDFRQDIHRTGSGGAAKVAGLWSKSSYVLPILGKTFGRTDKSHFQEVFIVAITWGWNFQLLQNEESKMNALATATPDFAGLKSKLKQTWMAGDYDRFSRYMEADARAFYERLDLPAGCQFLDVGCGS